MNDSISIIVKKDCKICKGKSEIIKIFRSFEDKRSGELELIIFLMLGN